MSALFQPFASLRLTVALLGLSIFLVFVGTLAQVDHSIGFVVEKGYFRVWWAWIEWQSLVRFVEMFTRAEPQPVDGGFWFPGGYLIGSLMGLNLVTAHALRFRVAARGGRLTAGLVLLGVGTLATLAVVVGGMGDSLQNELSPRFCEALWQTLRAGLAGLGLLAAYGVLRKQGQLRLAEWSFAAGGAALLLLIAGWLYANPSARIDDAGLRILWQLAKGGAAAAVLLTGCWIVFHKRAGIVLLHSGIGLLMFGELLTGLTADEGQMQIAEGQTVSHTFDIRHTELAVVTATTDGGKLTEQVTVLPDRLLARHAASGKPITHTDLPFDLKVHAFQANSILSAPGDATNLATGGAGLTCVAQPIASVSGVRTGGGVNLPSAYVELLAKGGSKDSLGTWLVSSSVLPGLGPLVPQPVAAAEGSPTLELRFKRVYKPYSITLKDFRFDRYLGTDTPKNYSSDIVLRDSSQGVERDVRIWMNNPLRYAGDTLYQSSFDNATEATTVLQVVTNGGWMIPYVSCMLVGLGMLAHFGGLLARFGRRRNDEALRQAKQTAGNATRPEPLGWRHPLLIAPALAALLSGAYLFSKARPAPADPSGFHVQHFGQLPVVEGGRVKPIDTLARITLQFLSSRQEVKTDTGKLSASRWLLDTISGRPEGRAYNVFRVENLEVLELLGLEPRTGSYRYAYDEVMASRDELSKQIDRASAIEPKQRTLVQQKTLELADKLATYHKLVNAFGSPRIGFDESTVRAEVQRVRQQADALRTSGAALAVLPLKPSDPWQTLFEAEFSDLFLRVTGQPTNPATGILSGVIDAYAKNNPKEFNARLDKLTEVTDVYEQRLAESPERSRLAASEVLSGTKVRFEHFYHQFSPFYYCAVLYLLAFLLTCFSWLGWPRTLGRSATAVIVVTLLVHTFAVVARVYISGRPPVTTLYSSAIFIGWGAVLFGVVLEAIYRIGVGNAVASILGFATLLVAHFLSLDGDTFTVLQAVLDTQFWLATHVVCITLGYATTFLTGFLGIAYLVASHFPRRLEQRTGDTIIRMLYGTLCFALFFSFIGTVLGGLWADDSWGRFWGWDPKENGALIIVLWNALVLHARWAKLVGSVGLSMLAIGGNIATAWSWFGVNELGIGLHSYGFTEGRTFWLLMFVMSQLLLLMLGMRRKPQG